MLLGLVAAVLLGQGPGQPQKNLLDAQTVIRELEAHDPSRTESSLSSAFIDHLSAYEAVASTLPLKKSAQEWLNLLDEAYKVPRPTQPPMGPPPSPIGSLDQVFRTLPPPSVWPDIEEIIAKMTPSRDKTVLRLLFARLQGNDDEVLKLCDQVESMKLRGAQDPFRGPSQSLNATRLFVAIRRQDKQTLAQMTTTYLDSTNNRPWIGYLPDLILLLGPEKARETIAAAVLKSTQLDLFEGPELEMVKEEVLKEADRLKSAPWHLVDGYADAPLVEKLIHKFGFENFTNVYSNNGPALEVYLHELLSKGDITKAAALLEAVQYVPSFSEGYSNTPAPRNLASYFDAIVQLQSLVPKKDFWEQYVAAAIGSGRTETATKRIQELVADKATEPALRRELLGCLVTLHGSQGDLAAVKRDYLEIVAIPYPGQGPDQANNYLPFALAVDDPETIRSALAQELRTAYADREDTVMDAICRIGDYADGEKLEGDAMAAAYRDSRPPFLDDNGRLLCQLYYSANRPQDIASLLRDFPFWSVHDLSEFGRLGSEDFERQASDPLVFYAAWAFAKTGQSELAIRTLDRLLPGAFVSDEGYSLLNKIDGAKALALYDALIAAHPYEPRPLLWKGELFFELGRLDEAENCVRRAIALDPTEDYTEKGHGYETFAILKQILNAKGDKTGVEQCEMRIEASQSADHAADLREAGMLPQAQKLFEESLKEYPGDFTVEYGLGDCLSAEGKFTEADDHYRRAYELMPTCCGEGTALPRANDSMFFGSVMQRIGRAVIAGFAKEAETNPEYAYVKGSFETWAEPAKAAEDFERAIQLDPLHYEALKGLDEVGKKIMLDPAKSAGIASEMIEMNPDCLGSWDSKPDLSCTRDLAKIYGQVRLALNKLHAFPTSPIFTMHSADAQANSFAVLHQLSPGSILGQIPDVREILGEYQGPGQPAQGSR